jgi:hypothetical protein
MIHGTPVSSIMLFHRNLEIYFSSADAASQAAIKLKQLHDGVLVSHGNTPLEGRSFVTGL